MSRADSSGAAARAGLSVGAKLALATVAIVSAITAVVSFELTRRERQALLAAKHSAATVAADLLATSLVAPVDFADEDAIESDVKNLSAHRDVLWAAVFPGAGPPRVTVFRAGSAPGAIAPPFVVPGEVWHEQRLEVARPIVRADGKRLGAAVVALDLTPELETFAASRRRILWMALLVAGTTAGLIVITSRRQIVRPLMRLTEAAARIEHGERGVRVGLETADELGTLGRVFDGMSGAIVERETRLAEATQNLRELFDHMRQAIVVFGADGKIEAVASKQACALFGDVAGRSIRDVLYPEHEGVEVQAFDEWLKLAFEIPSWSDVAPLAPANVRIGNRHLALEFEPIEREGRTAKLMLLAIDVTVVHDLRETVRVQEEEHARQIRAMRRLIAGGGQVFVSFLSGARERLERCRALLSEELTDAAIEEVLRHIHTVKGEASAFDLAPVVETAHAVEDVLVRLRAHSASGPRAVTADDRKRWLAMVDAVTTALSHARDLFLQASPIGPSILEQVTVHRADIDRLQELAGGRGDALGKLASHLAARPFGEACALLAEKVPTWAATLGKSARLEVEGRDVRVPRALAAILPGVLAHLVRNAVVHGIEAESDRGEKPRIGVIRAQCTAVDDGVTIVVEDDGRGVDVDALRRRAGTDGALDDLLFRARVSAADTATDLAGRGVGLAAVRSSLMSVGYAVRVDSDRGVRVTMEKRA